MQTASSKRLSLVLSGGGARGAYQAGALKAVAEICKEQGRLEVFKIITGVSAGAINAAYLAARKQDFLSRARLLTEIWQNIQMNQVFRTDVQSFTKIGWHLCRDILGSGTFGGARANFLLDASPLLQFLAEQIDFDQIQHNLQTGLIDALAVSATHYINSENITFVSSAKNFTAWQRSRRMSEAAQINVHHICASAAIPLFFPPIKIDQRYFGDGCLRNTAPLSPALHLGADSLLVIGVQYSPAIIPTEGRDDRAPSIARILSVLLNSVLLDGVAIDIERVTRINSTLSLVAPSERHKSPLRIVDCLQINPTEDISAIAFEEYSRMPRSIRYLMGGLGDKDDAGNLISYLLFVPSYCQRLVELGYQDARDKQEEIARFIMETLI